MELLDIVNTFAQWGSFTIVVALLIYWNREKTATIKELKEAIVKKDEEMEEIRSNHHSDLKTILPVMSSVQKWVDSNTNYNGSK